MGTGASNQVRSRMDSKASNPSTGLKVETIKTSGDNSAFFTTTNISNKSKVIPHQRRKSLEKDRTSKPNPETFMPSLSCHRRKSSQTEIEDASSNTSKNDLHKKIKELELSLAVSESHQLDLEDQLQSIEDKNILPLDQSAPALMNDSITLNEIIKSKNQHIKKLEEDKKNAEIEFKNKAVSFKKRIRGLKKQILELRQEALITNLEQKTKLFPKIDPSEDLESQVTSKVKETSLEGTASNINYTKLIVELSNQISEQEEQIARLTAEVVEKNKRIVKLEAALDDMRKVAVYPVSTSQYSHSLSNSDITSINRAGLSREEKNENALNYSLQISSWDPNTDERSPNAKNSHNSLTGARQRHTFEYSSTALSDSDPDWEEGPQVHRHSAPVHGRSRSKLSTKFTRNNEDRDDLMSSVKMSKPFFSEHRNQAKKQS